MNYCSSKTLKKLTILTIGVGLMGGLSACSTTSTMKVSEAAPVTYKVGEGSSTYAALRLPDQTPAPMASQPSVRPQASPLAVPSQPAVRPVQPQPLPRAAVTPRPKAPSIDLSDIDRGLYDNMKVGKSYKVAGQTYHPKHNPDYDKIGVASWYGDKFHGKPTANGEIYDKTAMTAAHKTLPLNSFVYVTNIETGETIKVRLNDRGPFIDGRIIDLSQAAAIELGITSKGLGKVRVQYAGPANADNNQAFAQKPVSPPAIQPQVAMRPESLQESYRPLRELGDEPSYVAAPSQQHYSVPDIMGGNSNGLGIMLPDTESADAYRMPPIPQGSGETSEEGVVTLTIKGPIHMARSETDDNNAARFIPASYEGEK